MNEYWTPLIIFVCCVANVTVNTMKMYCIANGSQMKATILEVINAVIWMFAIGSVISNLDNWLCYVAWALGQGLGVWIGMNLARRFQKEKVSALSITPFGYYFMNYDSGD